MSVDLCNILPVDAKSPKEKRWLDKLQGNILQSHGRDFTLCIFFSISDELPRTRQRLASLTGRYVTSAWRQQQEVEAYRNFGIPGGTFGSLMLSASGYHKLGLDPAALFTEPAMEDGGPASAFASGMKKTATLDFADPPIPEWQPPYSSDIDAMLLLADDDESHLLRVARRALDRIDSVGRVCTVEHGHVLRDIDGRPIEHFGFADGISQPLFLRSDFKYDANGNRLTDRNGSALQEWDPFEPLRRVLIRDTGVADDEAYGSFLVFRKLEQDVEGFRAREEILAAELSAHNQDGARAGALIVGRFRDGTPILTSDRPSPSSRADNDFQYAADRRGRFCPHQAHIRKVNPRGDALRRRATLGTEQDFERQRRITRRGLPYGSASSASGAGLLFMCFQANIRRQFAFIQKNWANDVAFTMGRTGLDTIVGQGTTRPQQWPIVYGRPERLPLSIDGFVRMRGGEFFFAPSLPFLLTLADRTPAKLNP